MYSAVFSGDRSPYSPAKFLHSWWQQASNLANYEQQDAHEFFISILDRIHENMEDDQHKSRSQGCHRDCCIAHRVFSGVLRSDVTCTNCGFTSTTYDPCLDISLDLDSGRNSMASLKPHIRNGEKDLSYGERIPEADVYKEASISYLLPYQKIRAFISQEDVEKANELSSEFEIFAVITHSGRLDAGHYVTYLRLNDHWYKCDDTWITSVDENIVRASQAYMLFYVQKMLCYEAREGVAAS
uniref:ubiquitinyl hydrolase 1 n=1 Tax=Ananas comosus var. bracteatus TaxID=296719 RepID=A0A6V7P4P0_ANACO|nr:unnamed protein product [Ananas comosus var. bracteatus]